MLVNFLDESKHTPPTSRRFVISPNTPLSGYVKRDTDIALAAVGGIHPFHLATWRQVLIAIDVKASKCDNREDTWLCVLKYARGIFRAQDSRRFVLGFALCLSIMRLWEFDRLGATSSIPLDIHQHGFLFVRALLTFLWMRDEQLGFDPDLTQDNGQRLVKITNDGVEDRLTITDSLRGQAPCIAGRATTCWKATRKMEEDGGSPTLLVIKDSW